MKRIRLPAVLSLITATHVIIGISPLWAADTSSAPAVPDAIHKAADSGQSMVEVVAAATDTREDYRVPGSVLRPRDSSATFAAGGGGGCIYVSGGTNSVVWNTPVYLPEGATVHTLRMYYDDTSAVEDSTGWFTIYNFYGGLVQEWSVDSEGEHGIGITDSAAIDHVIDYSQYSYVLNWRSYVTGSSMQLCGFRIFYTPDPSRQRTVLFPIVVNKQ